MYRGWPLNIGLGLSIGLVFPVYRHMQHMHQLVQTAKSTRMWGQIPQNIPARADYVDALQKQAKSLSLKLSDQSSTVSVQGCDPLAIYTFLYRIIQMPALQVESFHMKREKQKVTATIKSIIPEGHRLIRNRMPQMQTAFYSPRFFYVNAVVEVDGQKQIWVNGQSYGVSCPWPLYHTFDLQTDTVKKGDLRPRLSLTSET